MVRILCAIYDADVIGSMTGRGKEKVSDFPDSEQAGGIDPPDRKEGSEDESIFRSERSRIDFGGL